LSSDHKLFLESWFAAVAVCLLLQVCAERGHDSYIEIVKSRRIVTWEGFRPMLLRGQL